MKNIRIFVGKLSVFGGEIFNIFEYVSFCNGVDFFFRRDLICSKAKRKSQKLSLL